MFHHKTIKKEVSNNMPTSEESNNNKHVLQLQSRFWIDLYNIFLEKHDTLSKQELLLLFSSSIQQNSGCSPEYSSSLAEVILSTFTPELMSSVVNFAITTSSTSQQDAYLSLEDITILKEKLSTEESPEVRRLLISFAVYARVYPHHSFWIKYEPKVISYLASTHKKKVSEQFSLTNRLHKLYNLNMRVVGSTLPIPCFQLEWQVSQSPVSDDGPNPLVYIGPLSPATITTFDESLQGAKERIK